MNRKFTISLRGRVFGVVALMSALGACADPEASDDEHLATISREGWVQLGGNLNLEPLERVSKLALAGAPLLAPVIAYAAADVETPEERKSSVLRFREGDWEVLGPPLGERGPTLGADIERRIFTCTGGGPFVGRWNGTGFAPVGGDIAAESGYRGARYLVDSCGGLVHDRSQTPIVVWSADVGAKAHVIHAARYSAEQGRWEGLSAGPIGERATFAALAIDAQDRPHVVTHTPGGSYGGGATTRVFRLNGNNWQQLGEDFPNTSNPALAISESLVHLALRDSASGELRVLQLQGSSWQALPSPGVGDLPALDHTLSGNPLVAFAEGDAKIFLRVSYWNGETWIPVGENVSDDPTRPIELVDLKHEAGNRPFVAWSQLGCEGIHTNVFVKRYTVPLP
jgi:hypothetical protein